MYKHFSLPLKLLFVFTACLSSVSLRGQNNITGFVTDSAGAAFPFVNIALLSAADSAQVKGTISDEQGYYDFSNVKTGTCLLKFFSVGCTVQYSQALSMDSTSAISLPPLALRSSGVNPNEASVTAIQKVIEFKNGMTVLNVENSIMASGNTVLDISAARYMISATNTILLTQGLIPGDLD